MTTFATGVSGDKNNPPDLVDQCRSQGIRELSRGSTGNLPDGIDHSGRRRQGGHRQTAEGARVWRDEISLPYHGNAFRVVYAVQIGTELWVVHAFQKKSTQGIKTPKHEIDLIAARVKRLKEMLR
jgi:hypothetical protein